MVLNNLVVTLVALLSVAFRRVNLTTVILSKPHNIVLQRHTRMPSVPSAFEHPPSKERSLTLAWIEITFTTFEPHTTSGAKWVQVGIPLILEYLDIYYKLSKITMVYVEGSNWSMLSVDVMRNAKWSQERVVM